MQILTTIFFANNHISQPIARPLLTTQTQSHKYNYNLQPLKISKTQSVSFPDQRNNQTDRDDNCSFFQQNKNYPVNKKFNKNQPHFSEDKDFFNQSKQNQHKFIQR